MNNREQRLYNRNERGHLAQFYNRIIHHNQNSHCTSVSNMYFRSMYDSGYQATYYYGTNSCRGGHPHNVIGAEAVYKRQQNNWLTRVYCDGTALHKPQDWSSNVWRQRIGSRINELIQEYFDLEREIPDGESSYSKIWIMRRKPINPVMYQSHFNGGEFADFLLQKYNREEMSHAV